MSLRYWAVLDRARGHSYDFDGNDAPLVTQNRHRVHLQNALMYLDAFLETGMLYSRFATACPHNDY